MFPKIFDIHSHLNFPQFDRDRESVLKEMREQGIWTICVGTDRKTSQECVDLSEKHKGVFASAGLHPADSDEEFDIDYYRELTKYQKVVAIGECGLDYFRIKDQKSRNRQKEIFMRQIELARETNKPLMIHCREAHNDVLKIISDFKIQDPNLRGNIHFFSGDWKQAQKYLELGFTISFAGPITFTSQYDEIITKTPLDKIMIESDSPFTAPAPYRGKRNEPLYVKEIAGKIARVRGISYEKIVEVTVKNAIALFLK